MPSEDECVQDDPAKYPNDMAWSRRFQWLPFDVSFDQRDGGASRYVARFASPTIFPTTVDPSRISSYINNVHPRAHRSFYANLEAFIDSTLPLFNRSLMELKAPGYQNQRFHVLVLGRDPEIIKSPGEFRPPEQRATRQWLDDQGRFNDWLNVDLKREFWNIGIQMVAHVRHIRLDSAHPRYEGEEYHVQGQMVGYPFVCAL